MCLRLLLPLLAATATLFAAPPTQWDWISPVPHRQTWNDFAVGPNGLIGLTDGYGNRQIYHTSDGAHWELAIIPSNAGLGRVIFANGNYLAVGKQETIASSTDGVDWQIRNTNAAGLPLFDIAYGNGVYVAVGYNSVALYSKDLKNWTPLDFPKGYSLVAIQFGNGVFVAVANSGKIYRSVDGRIWNESAGPDGLLPDAANFGASLAFNNGIFVLNASYVVATSPDGAHWTNISGNSYRRIFAVGDRFFASAWPGLASSSNGVNWQTVISPPDTPEMRFNCVGKFGDHWLAGGFGGLLYTSSNGVDWEAVSKPIDYSHSHVAFANGRFIRYGADSGQFVSSDGTNWNFNPDAPDLTTAAGGNGMIVGITGANEAAVSTDGANWRRIPLPAQATGPVQFGNGTFVVASDGGLMISSNGTDWELIQIPGIKSIRLIGFENGIFAGLSDSFQPMTSADGRAWQIHDTQPGANVQFFAAGNGRFVGIGGGGMGPGFVTTSTDGAHWQRKPLASGSTYIYTGLEFGGGSFLMTDNVGSIFYSPDGITWDGGRQAPQPFTGAAYGNGAWIVVGGDSILRSSEALAANSTATLQLTRSDFSTWSLIVNGSVGEHWQIQTCAGVDAPWTPLQTVEIPVAGTVAVPLALNQSIGLFRVVLQP
jgi:hypothetical protein